MTPVSPRPRVPTDWPLQLLLAASLALLPCTRTGTTLAWTAMAALLAWRLARRETSIPGPILVGAGLCLATRLLSILSSVDVGATWRAWLGWAGLTLPVLAVAGRRDRGPIPGWLHLAWLGSTLGLGLWLLGELLSGCHILLGPLALLGFPMMMNATDAGHYCVLLFAWIFAFALEARGNSRFAWHAGWITAVAMLAACSEKAPALAFLGATAFSCWRARRPIMGAWAVAAFGVFSWVFPRTMWQRAVELGNLHDASILYRLKAARAALKMFAERPFTGEGFGAWKSAYAVARVPGDPWPLFHTHNVYLQTLAETGLLGTAGLLALFWGFRRVWRSALRDPHPFPEELGITAALAGFAVAGMFDEMWVAERGYAFFVLAALAWGRRGSLTPGEAA